MAAAFLNVSRNERAIAIERLMEARAERLLYERIAMLLLADRLGRRRLADRFDVGDQADGENKFVLWIVFAAKLNERRLFALIDE